MTTSALDLEGRVGGRGAELALLDEALTTAGRHGGQYALVTGAPGVGKTTLLRAFADEVSSRGATFAYGRFQEGGSAPYSALNGALTSLVRSMESTVAGERRRWRSDVRRAVTAVRDELSVLVPDLGVVLGATPGAAEPFGADRRPRLHRAVARLVAVAASFRPVVIAIDDLQWADRDSLLMLSELLAASIRNLLVVGAFRAGDFDPGSMDLPPDGASTIELRPLSADDLEELLAAAGGRTPELGAVAAALHRRTDGNPLQVRQLVRLAERAGAYAPSRADERPAWDLDRLGSIDVAAGADGFLGQAIGSMVPAEVGVLAGLACIGHSFDLGDAAVATELPADMVAKAIWSALDRGLLEAVDAVGRRIAPVIDREAQYRFSHDRVAEAARAPVDADAQRAVHLRMGRLLLDRHNARFEAARHLGIGGLGLPAGPERVGFAEFERDAAELARRQASYPVALDCCRAGLALLGERRWVDHRVLTRELQLAAAEAAYLVSDHEALTALIDEAETVLDDAADQAHLAFLRLKGLLAQHRLQDAMESGLRALEAQGERIAPRPSRAQAAAALLRTRFTMRRWSDERLLALPRCADPRVVEIHAILGELRSISYNLRPELFPVIVRKEVELTLVYGLAPSAPFMIASFGVLLVATGDHRGAQRFGELGRLLAERPEFRAARPQTQFLRLNFIRHWERPIREGLPQLQDAFDEALELGDLEHAGYLAAVLLYQSFWIGRPLPELDALAEALTPEIRSQRVPAVLCQSTQQLFLNLMGRTADPFLLAGESGYDERDVLPLARSEQDVVSLSGAAITKLGLHFWYGDLAGCLPLAEETHTYLAGMSGTPNVQLFHMVNALSRIRAAPGHGDTAVAVRRSLRLHRRWAAQAPANYAAPHELIAGVWALERGDLRRAEGHLDRAIELAETHVLPLISALAQEEAGVLYSRTGRGSLSMLMTRAAHQRWVGIGMKARSDRLERMHPWLVERDLVRVGSATVDPVGLHRFVQGISEARTFADLADVLMATVTDTTGASRVLLLTGDETQLDVRAVRAAGTTVVLAPAAGGQDTHDRSIVFDAAVSGRPQVVTGRGAVPGVAVTFVVPIRLRDRTIGAVYAELHEPSAGLGPGQEEAIRAVCVQAAARLWSFELEDRLVVADEHRQSLTDVQARFISSEMLRILDIDDISRARRGYRVERRMTVLISDIRGYTALLENMSLADASDVALEFLRAVEVPIITSNGLLQDVRGDEVLAVFDAEPDDALRAGLAMLRSLREQNQVREKRGSDALRVGIGINTGEVALGLVGGVNRMALTVLGDAVNLSSRIENLTKRYDSHMLLGEDTYRSLVQRDAFDIRRMERVAVLNRRRPVTIYEVYDEDAEPLRAAKRAAQPAFDKAFALFDAGEVDRARTAFEACRDLLPDDLVAPLHLAHCDALARGESVPGQETRLDQK